MGTMSENVVAGQEVVSILEQVQQIIVEHKKMLKNAELYMEKNGLMQEYDRYIKMRQSKLENKEKSMDNCLSEKTKKKVKEVNKCKTR